MIRITYWVKGAALLLLAFAINRSNATTIIPYSNLGQLASESDHVLIARVTENYDDIQGNVTNYRSKLRVLESIKSDIGIGQSFVISKWEQKIGEMTRVMWGDVHLQEGHSYLLFMAEQPDGTLHPICFSYYMFQQVVHQGEIIFQPSEYASEFILVEEFAHEPLTPFKKKELVAHLKDVLHNDADWDSRPFRIYDDLYAPAPHHQRAAPNHCSFLGTSNNFRWLDLPDLPIEVHYEAAGDPACSNALQMVQHSIDSLNRHYDGIQLLDGGSFSGFTPDCGSGTAQGSNVPDYISTTYGGSRHTLVQFDDPCNKIPNLSGCSGTLAVGGLYGIGTHLYDGKTWWTGAYGYVVINNDVGSCMCTMGTYGSMITHELTHTLGLGHISSLSGSANMNPSCCNVIENLDMDCVNYVYESSVILPVELVGFKADAGTEVNWIEWQTVSEINSDRFVLERSEDAGVSGFKSIGSLPGSGNSNVTIEYEFIDRNPRQSNYYRLKSVDLDGTIQHSEIVYVEREPNSAISVYPTDVSELVYVHVPPGYENATIALINPSGQLIQRLDMEGDFSQFDMHELPAGIYYVQISHKFQPHHAFKVRKL